MAPEATSSSGGDETTGDLPVARAALVGMSVGLLLAAMVAGPMVGKGQILLLDWVPGPHPGRIGALLGADGNTLGGSPFLLLLRGLRTVLGPSVAGWLPVVAWMPVVGGGVGALARRGGWPAAASAAALACCNPFTLDRMNVGQIGVLWGYALLPLAVLALTSRPDRLVPWAARAGLTGAAVTAVSPHFFAYWLVLAVAAVALLPMVRRRAVGALLAVGGALAASSYLFAVREPILPVTQADLSAYRTRVEPPGLAVTIATLRGFWRFSDVSLPRSSGSWVLVALLGVCVALGVVAARRRREAVVLAVVGLVGAVLAAGDQGLLGGVYRAAFDRVEPFRILREPQKASSLLAIALSVFFGFGVARLVGLLTRLRLQGAAAVLLAAVPLATVPGVPAFGTRAVVEQPSAAWRQVDRVVGPGPAGVLVVPWHQYLEYPGTGTAVANIAATRLRAPVASGDNVELPGLATTSNRRRSGYLEDQFEQGQRITDFGVRIAPAGLGWVLLVKTVDWTSYAWLEQQQDLERVLDTPELALYRSKVLTEPSPGSASQEGVAGWRVRAAGERPVPLPEVGEGRWTASRGRVEVNDVGAPVVLGPGGAVRSTNVQHALVGLAVSGVAGAVLALLACGRSSTRRRPATGGGAEAGGTAATSTGVRPLGRTASPRPRRSGRWRGRRTGW